MRNRFSLVAGVAVASPFLLLGAAPGALAQDWIPSSTGVNVARQSQTQFLFNYLATGQGYSYRVRLDPAQPPFPLALTVQFPSAPMPQGTGTIPAVISAGANAPLGATNETVRMLVDPMLMGESLPERVISITFIVTVQKEGTQPPPNPQPPPPPGVPSALLQPSALGFPCLPVGGQSAVQFARLRNVGTAPLQVNGVTIVGANARNFAIASGGSAGTIGEGQSRQIGIISTPQAGGATSAMLQVATNDPSGPSDVILTGCGTIVTPPPPPPPDRAKRRAKSKTHVVTAKCTCPCPQTAYAVGSSGGGPIGLASMDGYNDSLTLMGSPDELVTGQVVESFPICSFPTRGLASAS